MRETKIVNLDDLKNAVTIVLAGESFTIKRITMEMTDLYGEWSISMGTHLMEINKNSAKSADEKDIGRLAETVKEQEALLVKAMEDRNKGLIELLKLILEANNYKYDESWWFKNTNLTDIILFVGQAMSKDNDPKKKIAEEAESLTAIASILS